MIRQILIGAALTLAVGAGTQKCDAPAGPSSQPAAGHTFSYEHPTINDVAPPATESKPWCTPANSKMDSWLNNCHMPPAPPENQEQPTWALERDGDIDPRQPEAETSICAQPVGTGVSEYWPHTHAMRLQADKDCR